MEEISVDDLCSADLHVIEIIVMKSSGIGGNLFVLFKMLQFDESEKEKFDFKEQRCQKFSFIILNFPTTLNMADSGNSQNIPNSAPNTGKKQ